MAYGGFQLQQATMQRPVGMCEAAQIRNCTVCDCAGAATVLLLSLQVATVRLQVLLPDVQHQQCVCRTMH